MHGLKTWYAETCCQKYLSQLNWDQIYENEELWVFKMQIGVNFCSRLCKLSFVQLVKGIFCVVSTDLVIFTIALPHVF